MASSPERFTLYITNHNYSSWSLRTWLLMRRLAIPYTEKLVPIIEAPTQPHFFDFSPTGKVPCLHDATPASFSSDSSPLVVCESLALAEYLAEACPGAGVWPADVAARAWARQACAEMATSFLAVRDLLSFNIGVRVAVAPEELAEGTALRKDVDRIDALWAEGLARFGGPFLAGAKFSNVDAFFAPVVFRCQTFGIAPRLGEKSRGYVEMMLGLEEMREWEAESLKETWREAGHERDSIRGRKVLEDLRATA